MARKRRGRPTPTTYRFISTARSDYKEAIELYEKTGQKCLKWQSNLLKAILSKTKGGKWEHTKFGFSVPRRNGKNEVVAIRELYGLFKGEQILHTAHRTSASHMAWDRLIRLLELAGIPYDCRQSAGREQIMLDTGGKIDFRTRSSKGGLGEGADLLVIDEAQEYTIEQESALRYVVSGRGSPQTLFCGTPPTPYSAGTVFTQLRRSAVENNKPRTGWAEWSTENEAEDVTNREVWYETNPSLGEHLSEEDIEDELTGETLDFLIQRLGHWFTRNLKSAISVEQWEAGQLEKAPDDLGDLFVGVKFGPDGRNAALGVALRMKSGEIFIEARDILPLYAGVGWLVEFIVNAKPAAVAVDGLAGKTQLLSELAARKFPHKKIWVPRVSEYIEANSMFDLAIRTKQIRHTGQKALATVATNCIKRTIGKNGGFGYKAINEDLDIALLDSVMLAHWVCKKAKPRAKQKLIF